MKTFGIGLPTAVIAPHLFEKGYKSSLSQSESFLKQWKKVRYWSEDESRMGLHTIQRRKLTGSGIKPQVQVL